jgi:hypothetical protein
MIAMARDVGPTPDRPLSPETIARMREVLSQYVASPADQRDALGVALCDLADEARLKDIPPEHLLIVLKDLWRALSIVRDAARDEEARLLQRVVSMCIAAYYRA